MDPEETDRRIVKLCSRAGSPVNYFPLGCSGKLPSSPLLIFGKSTVPTAGCSRRFAEAGQSKVSFPNCFQSFHRFQRTYCLRILLYRRWYRVSHLYIAASGEVYVRQSISEHGDEVTNIPTYLTRTSDSKRPSSRSICRMSCRFWPVITSPATRFARIPPKSSNPASTSQKIDPPCPAR